MEKISGSETKDVLLAEDDLDDVLYFELALKDLPVSVVVRNARDGEKLFVMLKECVPDILFLDINMPCKDGITCIAEIRSHREYDHMPVIMYTAFRHSPTIEEAYRKGANFYLIKTHSIRQLSEKLQEIFSIDWKKAVYYPPKDEFVIGQSG